MKNTHKTLILLSWGLLLAAWVTMAYTFLVAYSNGYEVMVYINNYREAHVEFIILLVSFVMIFISTPLLFRKVME